jgi:glycosyltransferase involved in cell wall biosynthesis
MSLDQIYPVLIARDASTTIGKALDSLRPFPKVIVYDNGSNDDTIEICRRYSNVALHTGDFMGFGPTKTHAIGLASGDWILSMDADEFLSNDLVESLRRLDLSDEAVAYEIERHNLFMGKHVRHGGWGDNWLVRLFNRNHCRFDSAVVHEKVEVPPGVRIERISGPLWHQAVLDIDQFLDKISRYSELNIQRARRVHGPFVTFVNAGWVFFRSYVLKAGFLDGWRGLVIAVSDGVGAFFKHMKRYVNRAVPPDERGRTPE